MIKFRVFMVNLYFMHSKSLIQISIYEITFYVWRFYYLFWHISNIITFEGVFCFLFCE